MARQNTSAPVAAPPSIPPQINPYSVPNAQNSLAQQASMNPPYPFPPSTQPVNVPASAAAFATPIPGTSNGAQNPSSNPIAPFGAPSALPQDAAALQQQIMILKTLADTGVPQEQWGGIIAALTAAGAPGAPAGAAGLPQAQPYGTNPMPNNWGARPEESRDLNGYNDPIRSPNGRYRRRSRSISPQRPWEARDSASSHRRDDTGYGDYGRDSPGRGRGRGNEYRQRSPVRRGRSPTPPMSSEKWVSYDATIPKGNIKGT